MSVTADSTIDLDPSKRLAFHPLCAVFPRITGKPYAELKTDIKENGLLEPIVLHDGVILDGRNRYYACQEVGVTPHYREWQGECGTPDAYVVSVNLARRHMDESQRAMVAAKIKDMFAEQAKHGGDRKSSEFQPKESRVSIDTFENNDPNKNKAAHKAGELLNVGSASVARANKVLKSGDADLIEAVENGEKTVSAANSELKEREAAAKRAANQEKVTDTESIESISGLFSTILIDPPWDWADAGDNDQFGRARPQYHTMSVADLVKFPVGEKAADNAHLYLWVTSRALPYSFQLFDAWGFRYITAITWVKPSYGMGNYFRGQTEHILFGVRGSLPLSRKDAATVFYADRGPNGHSSKPEETYEIIESCSPGPYLEVFARHARDGWTAWGADA